MIETTIKNPEKHETITADSQGRISLGVEYAAHDVEIVVVKAEEHQHEQTGLQQTIGDRPMNEQERKGMLFVRSYGISSQFLKDENTVETKDDGTIDLDTVGATDVNWSYGYLVDPKNVARFEFDTGAEEQQFPARQQLTAEPTAVTSDKMDGTPVYRYENEEGDTSAVLKEWVENVQRVYGYDPTEELSNLRVNPDDAPFPVMFRDPDGETYIAIAPRIDDI